MIDDREYIRNLETEMVILHIAAIKNSPYDGVSVVVPQHVCAQSKYATLALMNLWNENLPTVDNQIEYVEPFTVESLPAPFNKPDLVVFHEIYRPQFAKIAAVLRRNKVPYVVVPHGALQAGALKKKFLKKFVANILLFNRFVNKAVAIQCLSDRELHETKVSTRKFIGTNGINLAEQQKADFRKTNLRFTYIGRLEAYHKGLDLLVNAVQMIGEELRKQKVSLYIYGPDFAGRYAYLEQLIAAYEVGDLISLNPAVTGDEKKDILLDSDAFVQTSRFEGMPMGILEAMGYGIPCLVTEGTTLGTMIADNHAGWSAKNDAESISKALLQAVNETFLYHNYSQNAVRLIRENFVWDVIAEKTVRMYGNIIKETRKR